MNKLLRQILCVLTITGATMPVWCATPSEIEAAVEAAKGAPRNQTLNRKAADMLKDAGRFEDAVHYYLKSGNSGNLGIAESNFYLYEFDKAEEYLDKYLAKRTKAEEAKDNEFSFGDGTETMDWTDHLRSRIELGRSMLDRVEKIQVVDSVNVPSDQFFRFMKLAGSAGRLIGEDEIENIVPKDFLDSEGIASLWAPAYMSESGDDVIWYGSSNDGDSRMYESFRLSDGSWDKPVSLFGYKEIFGNQNGSWVSYPFLMADGVTLYFAADGDNSLGELDIFISRRDDDGFLQPSNIGMPYNSPYNDYMYAVDEVTGAGWWATDRNGLKDSITIYTFIPQDLRINYPVDTPQLINFAKMSSIGSTQNPDADYSKIRFRIAAIKDSNSAKSTNKLNFALPNGAIIKSYDDFSNPAAVEAMRQYQAEQDSYKRLLTHLEELRRKYAAGDQSVSDEIQELELTVENRKTELRRLKNNVVNAEMN